MICWITRDYLRGHFLAGLDGRGIGVARAGRELSSDGAFRVRQTIAIAGEYPEFWSPGAPDGVAGSNDPAAGFTFVGSGPKPRVAAYLNPLSANLQD
ncbi:MAG: hypothetical protein ACSLE2_01605, partial [Lysobacterales bacterium]